MKTGLVWGLLVLLVPGTCMAGRHQLQYSWLFNKPFIESYVADELALDAEQKAAFRDLNREYDAARGLWLDFNGEELRTLEQFIQAATAVHDSVRVQELQQQYRAKLRELADLRRDYIRRFRPALNPWQRRQLDESLLDVREHRAEYHAAL
ncbi:MAG TPA: hypothetical protein VL486_10510 [Verrucomicrobiae bacterium]|nr:hypothetical protein [Verrucomicrobiae bacterium]